MLRKISAVLIGLLVTFALIITVGTWMVLPHIVRQYLPFLFGGFSAGFLARRWGWVLGLLVAVICEGFLLLFNLWAFSWSEGPQEVLDVWLYGSWLPILLALLVGAAGGYFGEYLARLQHIRSQENR